MPGASRGPPARGRSGVHAYVARFSAIDEGPRASRHRRHQRAQLRIRCADERVVGHGHVLPARADDHREHLRDVGMLRRRDVRPVDHPLAGRIVEPRDRAGHVDARRIAEPHGHDRLVPHRAERVDARGDVRPRAEIFPGEGLVELMRADRYDGGAECVRAIRRDDGGRGCTGRRDLRPRLASDLPLRSRT